MTHLYQDFVDHEGLGEENDDDIGALGSILSWDDEDQANDVVNGQSATLSSALRDREFSGGSSAPPDTVQFSLKDGQFMFLPQSQGNTLNGSQLAPSPQGNSDDTNITLQLPLPTPINSFVQQHQNGEVQNADRKVAAVATQAPTVATANTQQPPQQQQQQQQLVSNGQTQQGLASSFAQLLAQAQAGNLFQQQVNQQQQPNQQPQQPTLQGIQVQQNPTVAQPQPQPVQLTYTADPNTFLQQLQLAQLQQQLQAAQAQQVAQVQQQPQAAQMPQQQQQPTQVQQQQRMPAQFSQRPTANVPIAAAPTPVPSRTRAPPAGRQHRQQPPSKKPRTLSSKKPANQSSFAKSTSLVTSGSISGIVSASDTDGELSKSKSSISSKKAPVASNDNGNVSDNQNMSAADKAKANRDRNREHARNTRLRKKAYLEKLQTTVDELCRERDTLVSERTGAASLLVEMHNTRTEVLMSFFALRSTNEKRRKLWASILDESCFACVMPVTPYRSFPASEVQVSKCQRTILGIDSMMSDTASLHVLFNSLVDRTKHPLTKIDFRYTLVTEDAVVAGNQMMARWVMSTTNAVQCGARMEVAKQGMLCCKFNTAHKITGLELMFDVMAFMLQLKQAAGSDGFSVIPNTVQTCQRTFDKPMVMTLAEPPYTIIQVNKLWEEMTGYSAEEVVGKKSCSILQKSESNTKPLQAMMEEIRFKRPAAATLLNFKKSGERFRHSIMLFPLSTDSRVTHYLSLSSHVDKGDLLTDGGTPVQPVTTKSQNRAILPTPANLSGNQAQSQALGMVPPILFTGLQAVHGAVSNGPQGQITLPGSHILPNASMVPSMQMPPPSSLNSSVERRPLGTKATENT